MTNLSTKDVANHFMKMNLSLLTALVVVVFFVPASLMAENLSMAVLESDATNTVNKKSAPTGSEVLSSAKELKVLSQIIAKDYFYLSQQLREEQAKQEITQSIQYMDRALTVLEAGIKDSDTLNLLSYLYDSNQEFKALLEQNYSKEHGSQVLDFSETMYEGAQSIIEHLQKSNSKDKSSMDNVVLQQQLILQRISKYYIAYQAGFNDEAITTQLMESINEFEKGVNKISHHGFSNTLNKEVVKLKKYWPIAKKFYQGMEKGDLTLIVFISTDHMKSSLDKLYTAQI